MLGRPVQPPEGGEVASAVAAAAVLAAVEAGRRLVRARVHVRGLPLMVVAGRRWVLNRHLVVSGEP